jgi:hypothetical protein
MILERDFRHTFISLESSFAIFRPTFFHINSSVVIGLGTDGGGTSGGLEG